MTSTLTACSGSVDTPRSLHWVAMLCRADKVGLVFCGAIGASALAFGATPLAIGLPVTALMLTLADGVFRPASSVLVPTISRGPRSASAIALTFDDGPDPIGTPAVAALLEAAGQRATFFCMGKKLDADPDVARALLAAGHELGNHSYDHSYTLNFRGPAHMDAEITRGADAVRRITGGGDEPLYRPPVGLKNPPLSRVAQARGLRVVTWNVHSRDTLGGPPERVAARVLSGLQPGDIVLMHDPLPICREALPAILDGMAARGFTSVPVSELLAY